MVYCLKMTPFSLYLHIPFCTHRCSYCDFNTYAGLENLVPAYVQALCREIELLAESAGKRLPVHTVFFGGGTPSLLPADELERVLQALFASFELLAGLELTLEANPGTLSRAYLRDLRSLGVNRLSLGMQSAAPEELSLLEREHDFRQVTRAVAWSRGAGFEDVNLDLIFGLPYQSLASWQKNLELALGLSPDHLSLYALTLEHGTPMAHWVERGLLSEPDPDLAAEMYEWADDKLNRAGYAQYEISNWALEGERGRLKVCRHNLQYWRNQPYLGIGAGAHGFAGGVRTANVRAPQAYIHRLSADENHHDLGERDFPRTPATSSVEPIDRDREMRDTLLMGLRLTEEGVSEHTFAQRFGLPLSGAFSGEIEMLQKSGLLTWAGEGKQARSLRLTPRGRLLGNQVFMQFV